MVVELLALEVGCANNFCAVICSGRDFRKFQHFPTDLQWEHREFRDLPWKFGQVSNATPGVIVTAQPIVMGKIQCRGIAFI